MMALPMLLMHPQKPRVPSSSDEIFRETGLNFHGSSALTSGLLKWANSRTTFRCSRLLVVYVLLLRSDASQLDAARLTHAQHAIF